MGSLWPTNERKSMNLQILLVVLTEMYMTMQMNQSFRKVTDFNECVTVYGTDAASPESSDTATETTTNNQFKRPTTKFQFHINTEEPLIGVLDEIAKERGSSGEGGVDEYIRRALGMTVKRFFFELVVSCKEARKWGCSENYIVEK